MNKVNSLITDSVPLLVVYTEFASFHFFYYLIVVCSVKWRIAAEQNVENNTNTPEITLLVVFVIEHLWGDVVRGSKFLAHLLTRVKDPRSSKVDNSYLWVFLIPAHKNIFWFQVSVYYFSLVTVVY